MKKTFASLRELKERIAAARGDAIADARYMGECVMSRGTFLSTTDANGDQCEPNPQAECPTWKGTLREIDELIAAIADGDARQVWIGGGYDAAHSLNDWLGGDYEPWAGSWEVLVAE